MEPLRRCCDVGPGGVFGRGLQVETGVFGARMTVELANDGPVTIVL